MGWNAECEEILRFQRPGEVEDFVKVRRPSRCHMLQVNGPRVAEVQALLVGLTRLATGVFDGGMDRELKHSRRAAVGNAMMRRMGQGKE